jgi:GNAT superfamily N-acetyltransferase
MSEPSDGGAVAVRAVRGRRDLRAFLRLPRRIYAGLPAWVPPLDRERRAFLDRRRNPFFRHSEAEIFLAERAGETVGRIAAIENRRHLETYRDGTAFFGLFESIDEPDVARALVARAAGWSRDRGLVRLRGPASFTINDECGLLLDAFELPPVFLMAYNPPYYARLLEGCGFRKAQDLYAFRMDVPERVPAALAAAAEAARAAGVVVRAADFGRIEEEVARIHRVHSRAWAENWGAVPLTEDEVAALARELVPYADRDLVLFAERAGETIGVAIVVPDFNRALAAADGRLLPLGWYRLLRAKRRIDSVRVLILGVLREHRGRGVDAALYARMIEVARRKGYRWGELSWVLESNRQMLTVLERFGAERYKTYRIYDRDL